MSTVSHKPGPIKVKDLIDLRKQLWNGCQIGPIQQVAQPVGMITSLRGVLLDLDPDQFRTSLVPPDILRDPEKFYDRVIHSMLSRHPVLSMAQVCDSGRGRHGGVAVRPARARRRSPTQSAIELGYLP